ncbi:MAG: UbiA family prenyltransferase, partial [Chloroflexi bacterium]|nr:UbiA family prenyltransferase [Chloroflexota bacterium]
MLIALLKSMRPRQWTKNAFVFAALIFDQKLFVVHYFLATLAAFVIFCFLSSAVYIINDLADVEKDRQHPAKKNRPIASGQLSVRAAMVAGAVVPLVCLPLAFALNTLFGLVALGYFAE